MISGSEGANLTYGQHEVRLGGPHLSELPAGVVLRATGRNAGSYRVKLTGVDAAGLKSALWQFAECVVEGFDVEFVFDGEKALG